MLVLLHVHYPEGVTGRQRACLGISWRPCGHDQAPALGPRFEFVNDVADLVVERGLPIFMDGKVAPEIAVGARHQSVVVSPGFPELAAVLAQQINARVAGQKPEIFNDDILSGLGIFYTELNEVLAGAGIRPDIDLDSYLAVEADAMRKQRLTSESIVRKTV